MSATNQTANLHLPAFVGDDKPAWLTDWNGAMNIIDGAVAAAQTDIDGVETTVATQGGQISSLNTTVGNHTTSITALTDATTHNAGDINTINSLLGNGTPTTTDQTIIGAINELHADQGDLADLQTTDKSSFVSAINEIKSDEESLADQPSLFSRDIVTLASVTADGVKTYATLLNELAAALNTAMTTTYAGKKVFITSVGDNASPRVAGVTDLKQRFTGAFTSAQLSAIVAEQTGMTITCFRVGITDSIVNKHVVANGVITYADHKSDVLTSGVTVSISGYVE